MILTSRSKGKFVPDFLKYFIKKEAELKLDDLIRSRKQKEKEIFKLKAREEKKKKAEAFKEEGQTTLDLFPRDKR